MTGILRRWRTRRLVDRMVRDHMRAVKGYSRTRAWVAVRRARRTPRFTETTLP